MEADPEQDLSPELDLYPDGPAPAPTSPSDEIVAFRWCNYDVPFWVRQNSRPGRWHVVGDEPTQYWALSPEAAWGELIRHEELTTEAELDQVRMPIWVSLVPRTGLADLRIPALRDQFGLSLNDLTSDDWAACQQAGRAIRQEFRGAIAPSAALPDSLNVTLFGPRRVIALSNRPALSSTIPGAIVALGRPPLGLVGRVQRRTIVPTLF